MAKTKNYKYKYAKYREPLAKCPECDYNLTQHAGIGLVLSVAGHVFEVPSSLDTNGVLQDTDDKAVGNGYHSATYCGGCGELLINMEGVVEVVI